MENNTEYLRSITSWEQQALTLRYVNYGHGKSQDERIKYLQAMEDTLSALLLDNVPATMTIVQNIGDKVLNASWHKSR